VTITAHPTKPDASAAFSVRLRDGTREDHERAESSPFITAYLAGRVPREGYAALQGQLWFVYDALEGTARSLRDDPVVGAFLDPRLDRLAALDTDLRMLVGDDWRERVEPGPAALAHASRIREIGVTWPAGVIAHHYIRYLGDLSGGRALGSKARKLYQLTDEGVRFYRFDDIPSPAAFKDDYRRLLDTAPWSATEQARIIDEARTGFRMTGAMFLELDRVFATSVPA
jgi:heme oxygenase